MERPINVENDGVVKWPVPILRVPVSHIPAKEVIEKIQWLKI